jgi:hypothetical protein
MMSCTSGGSYFLRNLRLAIICVSLPLLAACSALTAPVVLDYGANHSVEGISALLRAEVPSQPLHVLIVHGMGTPQLYTFESFIQSLADRFGLVQVPPLKSEPQPQGCHQVTPAQEVLIHPAPRPIVIEGVPTEAEAQLYTYNFAPTPSDPPKLTVSFLLWTPLTESIKCALTAEDNEAPPKQAFAVFAKDFIDDKLGDAVLYSGSYRENVMRPSIQAGLCLMIDGSPSRDGKTCGSPDYNEKTVIITHSLGGYMLMDAIDDELRREKGGAHGKSAAHKILENTQFIYMMANQLALLDLSTLNGYPSRLEGSSRAGAMAQHFAQTWSTIKLKSPAPPSESDADETPGGNRQIVAFSDPNDILSWRLKPYNLELPPSEWPSVRLTNVYLSNGEFSVPLLFSDPTNAHGGYFVNPTVMDMLVCGVTKGAPRPCPPKVAP